MKETKTQASVWASGRAGGLNAGGGRLGKFHWPGWLPLMTLPAVAIIFRNAVPPWAFMCLLALAIFAGCKWLTWWRAKGIETPAWRHFAYLLAWPGMDAPAFLEERRQVARPDLTAWIKAILKLGLGVFVTWGLARQVAPASPMLAGWLGLLGLVLVFHFGLFDLLAVAWRHFGVNAQPLMRAPMMATSLADFWGHRWNAAFNQMAHDLVFAPLYRRIGSGWAMMLVFFISGIIHDLVISLPARAGCGLPTMYFLAQGAGVLFERSATGGKFGLRHGFAGRAFAMAMTAGPVFWLFHPPFIARVIIPFMRVIHAL